MPISSSPRLLVAALGVIGLVLAGAPARAQDSAVDAAHALANSLDGLGPSGPNVIAALEGAAAAGQPLALWRLGMMYENGEGVKQDRVRAFGYFSRIADDNADTPPSSYDADIVAQSFVKVGEYYRDGLPGAGISANASLAHGFLLHAASYFGDPDAQFQVGMLYLDQNELGRNPLQSARWLSLAARKGHVAAQAALGELLFVGDGIEAQPIDGLMWLTVAQRRAVGSPDQMYVNTVAARIMALATPVQREEARQLADTLGVQFGGL